MLTINHKIVNDCLLFVYIFLFVYDQEKSKERII